MLAVVTLTKQLGKLRVAPSLQRVLESVAAAPATERGSVLVRNHQMFYHRGLAAGNRTAINEQNAKRQKIQAQKKKKNAQPSAEGDERTGETNQPLLQHQEWVRFQQSISVEGFETGQITTASAIKKSKGGSQIRRKKERKLAEWEAKQQRGSLGKFPAIRYSEEETQRLLAEAMSMLPKRDGKRGTRNLKRQKRRWFLVRKIHAKQKRYRIRAHERKMERRSLKIKAIQKLKAEAPEIRERDLEYQAEVLQRWAARLVEDQETNEATNKLQSEKD